jgi:hypothetical protein
MKKQGKITGADLMEVELTLGVKILCSWDISDSIREVVKSILYQGRLKGSITSKQYKALLNIKNSLDRYRDW